MLARIRKKYKELSFCCKKLQKSPNQDTKAITSVGCPKMKRDAGVNADFLLRKKTAFTQASLFKFGR